MIPSKTRSAPYPARLLRRFSVLPLIDLSFFAAPRGDISSPHASRGGLTAADGGWTTPLSDHNRRSLKQRSRISIPFLYLPPKGGNTPQAA